MIFTGLVALISLLSIFLYQVFAGWLGPPINAITQLPSIAVRLMMGGGFLVYACAFAGSFLLLKQKKKGFWLYAIPVFLIITASLFIVSHPINLMQWLFLSASVIYLSTRIKLMS